MSDGGAFPRQPQSNAASARCCVGSCGFEQRRDPCSIEHDRIGSKCGDDRPLVLAQANDLLVGELHDLSVVACPPPCLVPEIGQLRSPCRVVVCDVIGPDDEQVYVACGISVSTRSRSEHRDMSRCDLPGVERDSEAAHELGPHAHQDLHRRRRKVLAVKREQICPVQLDPSDQAVLGQPVQRIEDSTMRAPSRKGCDLPTRQNPSCPGEHLQHLSIERVTDRCVWASYIHVDSLSATWLVFNPCGRKGIHLPCRTSRRVCDQLTLVFYSGMFPCLRLGPGSRLPCSVRSATISLGRVSCGTMTSSM